MSTPVEIDVSYYGGSGTLEEAYCLLGQRYDRATGFKSGEGESWVLSARYSEKGVAIRTLWASDSWFTAVWRSPAGVAYVSDADLAEVSTAIVPAPVEPVAWKRTKLDSPLYGVWGLDDTCVFAWGSTFAKDYPFFRFDGRAWNRIADPGFRVYDVHGIAPDLVYAVGDQGQIARFDGRAWQPFASPTSELLTSAFVVSGDEIYACGRGGSLLEGSATGWGKIAEGPGGPGPLHAVAKWGGELWVAAGIFGLLRRVGNTSELEAYKPKVKAERIDTRRELALTCPNMVAYTKDGKSFSGGGIDILKTLRAGKSLLDFS